MFEHLTAPKADPILSLISEFKNDTREHKIDLGIGVYRNEAGITPIMQAVCQAEALLLEQETTKAYQGLTGDEEYNQLIQELLLNGTNALERASTLQTPGASGALRMLADLIASTNPNATVWLSNPSYVNHRPIMTKAGLKVAEYAYLDPQTKLVNEQAFLQQVKQLGKDDVLLVHGCCHNPSGADLSLNAWQAIAECAQQQGFLPFVDIAYQGLGDGLAEDAKGMQIVAEAVDEMLISTSCSKNFGLYRERTGAAMVISKTAQQASNARAKMCELARSSYSMPPASGAAIVKTILQNAELTELWQQELTAMNVRVNSLRTKLVTGFQNATQSNRFDYFGEHKGMFSLTGISDEVIAQLKADFGIYIVKGGRINVAGLKENQVDTLVQAFIKTGA